MNRFSVASLLAMTLAATGSAVASAQTSESCEGPASDTRLIVNIERVRSSDGLVAVTLYADDKRRFLAKKGSLYVGRVPARANLTRMCIHVPKPGVYSLAVYHDVDGDRKFDKNAVGLPAEAYGFSNNPSTVFGLPAFTATRIRVPQTNTTTTVRLKYPGG